MDGIGGALINGGWSQWVQENASKVVSSYLPTTQPGPSTLGATGTNTAVLGAPVSGLPATIGGMKFTTVVAIGGALVVALIVLPRFAR